MQPQAACYAPQHLRGVGRRVVQEVQGPHRVGGQPAAAGGEGPGGCHGAHGLQQSRCVCTVCPSLRQQWQRCCSSTRHGALCGSSRRLPRRIRVPSRASDCSCRSCTCSCSCSCSCTCTCPHSSSCSVFFCCWIQGTIQGQGLTSNMPHCRSRSSVHVDLPSCSAAGEIRLRSARADRIVACGRPGVARARVQLPLPSRCTAGHIRAGGGRQRVVERYGPKRNRRLVSLQLHRKDLVLRPVYMPPACPSFLPAITALFWFQATLFRLPFFPRPDQ
jgi:hypothetical protein